MQKPRHKKILESAMPWWTCLLVLILLWGCQSKEPPLSPKAAAFAQAMRESISSLAPVLVGPVSQKDLPAVQAELEKFSIREKQEGKLALIRLSILDDCGVVITNFPQDKTVVGDDFSKYTACTRALQDKSPTQERLYGPDGGELYSIFVPLLNQDKVVGVVRFLLDAEKVKEIWGVTTEEFLSLNFPSIRIKP